MRREKEGNREKAVNVNGTTCLLKWEVLEEERGGWESSAILDPRARRKRSWGGRKS